MLIAYEVALDLVRALRPVVAQLRSYSPEADQVWSSTPPVLPSPPAHVDAQLGRQR